VALEQRDPAVPMICLETALAAKFSSTIVEAIGREPGRPAAYSDLESRPQHCEAVPADVAVIKRIIAERAARPLAP
jgi:threonine synthase